MLRDYLRGVTLILTACISIVSSSAGAQVAKLPRVDEAERDPSFLDFRTKLLKAAAQRDVEFLLAVTAPDIRVSFDDRNGVAALRASWKLESPNSEFWDELIQVLNLGGSFSSPDIFVAPYTFSTWPSEVDDFDYVAVTGDNVRVREVPRTDAAVLATLSFDIIAFESNSSYGRADVDPPPAGWSRVRLATGRIGYIAERYTRHPIDYRAYFARRNGEWKMVTFIEGD